MQLQRYKKKKGFTPDGLKASRQPKAKYPSHADLFAGVVNAAVEVDFLALHDPRTKGLREKAEAGDKEAVKLLDGVLKSIKPKDYKVHTIEEFCKSFTDDLRFNSFGGSVYAFNGEFWQMVEEARFAQLLAKVAEKYGVPGTTPRDEDFVTKLVRQFHLTADHPEPKAAALVNLTGGTLRIDGKGVPSFGGCDWREFVRYKLPYSYDPAATAPKLQKFLDEVLPNKNHQQIIFEYLGLCFAPWLKTDDKILLLYGQGANGKSVLCEVVTALFGAANIAHVNIDKLTQQGQPGEFAAVELDGKLLNFATELNGKALQSDLLKQLASREPIRAAFKHKDAFTITPPPMITNCNELPRTGARDLGFYRRLQIIPFDVTIPPERRNPNLAKELIETELPGFLNLVLKGLQRLIDKRGHFTENPQGDMLTRELWAENDSVTAFIEDKFDTETSKKSKQERTTLYELYNSYCCENGRQPLNNRAFFSQLRQRGYEEGKSDGARYFIFPNPLKSW